MSRDQTVFVDDVKVTFCAYRKPRKSERTFDIDKSKYTPWAQTVAKYVRGSGAGLLVQSKKFQDLVFVNTMLFNLKQDTKI